MKMENDLSSVDPTAAFDESAAILKGEEGGAAGELMDRFQAVTSANEVRWEIRYRLIRRLGAGGQGVVFLADRRGAFGTTFRLALKFFRPDGYSSVTAYNSEMARLARVATTLARIQQDHLLDLYNVIELDGLHVLTMEWVDGYGLRELLKPRTLDLVRATMRPDRWDHVNDVVVTKSAEQLRLKPGVATAILRECLSGVAALHRTGIVHADLKPSNLMIKRTGNCKVIDFGSAFLVGQPAFRSTWTPRYAAVEVLEGAPHTPQADLASLGYMLFEMLSGQYPFVDLMGPDLIEAKRRLPQRLREFLPAEVARNERLLNLIRRLIAPNPADRFCSAEDADQSPEGAAAFERELVRANLSSDYANEIRLWLSEIEQERAE
ncbi:serine/threonine-protein kinase [Planctomyces sp. SH-PL14]|uniref:serine/threonine-protein kinase n=1 Tax=Planctomyces sp. SH-PL14 TaxID=1632864 RepID=UPI00094638CA|nr:serine/threonine-protein kinase [Planctomyces sp. SH-PL14]